LDSTNDHYASKVEPTTVFATGKMPGLSKTMQQFDRGNGIPTIDLGDFHLSIVVHTQLADRLAGSTGRGTFEPARRRGYSSALSLADVDRHSAIWYRRLVLEVPVVSGAENLGNSLRRKVLEQHSAIVDVRFTGE
jgi:hypothetical protein